MGTAVSALEALTELVENIGELGSSPEANSKLADLATSLTEIAQVILSQVGKPPAEEPPAEPPADAAAGETPPEDPEAAEKSDDKVADSLEKAKALVEQFGSVVKSGVSKKDDSAALAKSIEDINASIKKFTDVLTETCQRVSKVEKQFGVPASQPAESVTKAASAEVAWPADLNAPTKSRENA
jgi:ribosomal protein L7/L12